MFSAFCRRDRRWVVRTNRIRLGRILLNFSGDTFFGPTRFVSLCPCVLAYTTEAYGCAAVCTRYVTSTMPGKARPV